MKIALCFFGITRSLKYTHDSIDKNILSVLKRNSIDFDIFLHTYNVCEYVNKRAGEKSDNMDNEEYALLRPRYLQIDNQDEIKSLIGVEKYRSHPDPWNTGYNSVDNFILAQYSKLQIVNMIDRSNNCYDYVIYIRPDMLYINEFQLGFLDKVTDGSICIPNFHLYKNNFNDRFAITNMKTYKIYGNVFTELLDMSKKKSLHSETIIGDVLQNNNIKIIHIPFRFRRVRCDGRVIDHTFNNYYDDKTIERLKNELNFI
jgi:hypothetical protein